MAVIYTKSTSVGNENCVIASPREAIVYPFGFSNWNKIRVGMFLSYTSPTDPNANMDGYGSAVISAVTDADRIHYGVKKNVPGIPSLINQPFVGFKNYGSQTYIQFPTTTFDHRNQHGPYGVVGVHHPNGGSEGKVFDDNLNQAFTIVQPSAADDDASGFAGLFTLYLEIVNKGKSNQQMIVRYSQVLGTSSSRESLRTTMIGTSLTTAGTFNYNLSGVPYDLPDSFFIYNPISSVRTRTFGVMAIKEE